MNVLAYLAQNPSCFPESHCPQNGPNSFHFLSCASFSTALWHLTLCPRAIGRWLTWAWGVCLWFHTALVPGSWFCCLPLLWLWSRCGTSPRFALWLWKLYLVSDYECVSERAWKIATPYVHLSVISKLGLHRHEWFSQTKFIEFYFWGQATWVLWYVVFQWGWFS